MQRDRSTRYRKGRSHAMRRVLALLAGVGGMQRVVFMRYRLGRSQLRFGVHALPLAPVLISHQGPCVTACPGLDTASGSTRYRLSRSRYRIRSTRYRLVRSRYRSRVHGYRLVRSQYRIRVHPLPIGPVSIPLRGPCVTAWSGLDTASGPCVTAWPGRIQHVEFMLHSPPPNSPRLSRVEQGGPCGAAPT